MNLRAPHQKIEQSFEAAMQVPSESQGGRATSEELLSAYISGWREAERYLRRELEKASSQIDQPIKEDEVVSAYRFDVEFIGRLGLTRNFWDCECNDDYIHHRVAEHCDRCGANRDESPDSILAEVLTRRKT